MNRSRSTILALTLALAPCTALLAGCPEEAKPETADASPHATTSATAALTATTATDAAAMPAPMASMAPSAMTAPDAGMATDAGKDSGKPGVKK